MSSADTLKQAPAGFPVAWRYPEDAALWWASDRLHFPAPVTPMFGAFYRRVVEGGLNRAAEAYELPVRVRFRRINSYLYMNISPDGAAAGEREARRARSEEKLHTVMGRLEEVWNDLFLPEIERELARWASFDTAASDPAEALVHLNEIVAVITRLYEIHFLVWFPFSIALLEFDELYNRLFGTDEMPPAHRLLRGFDNKTLEADRALFELSRKARRQENVRRILETMPPAGALAELKQCAEGRAFLAKLQKFLGQHGYRSTELMSLASPYWIEDPAPALAKLQEFVKFPDRDLVEEMTGVAADREAAIAKVMQRLKGHPDETKFEFLLTAAQEATVLEQDHTYWIDCRAMYEVRRILLEFGRRFAAAGVLAAPDDIFYLEKEELHAVAAATPGGDLRPLVAARKQEMEGFRKVTPPDRLGTPSAEPLPDSPAVRVLARFFA